MSDTGGTCQAAIAWVAAIAYGAVRSAYARAARYEAVMRSCGENSVRVLSIRQEWRRKGATLVLRGPEPGLDRLSEKGYVASRGGASGGLATPPVAAEAAACDAGALGIGAPLRLPRSYRSLTRCA